MIEVAAPQEQPMEKVDRENEKNPQYVVPYVNEIFEYLRSDEVSFSFLTIFLNIFFSPSTYATLTT